MVEAVVVIIRHGKTPKVIIKEINRVTEEMDIISKEANGKESGIINKINSIGILIIEIQIGTTVIIIQWLNQRTVTITDMMNDGVTGSRQVEEKEIIMAAATRLNVSSILKAVGGRAMPAKQLLTIRPPVALVSPVTTIVRVGELMVGTILRAINHATAPSSHHRKMITVLVFANQGAVAEVELQSSVVVIRE